MYKVFHIGKSAGTTLVNFLKQNKIPSTIIHAHTPKHINLQHLNDNNNRKIILLRDPCKRYMSVFYYWLRNHNYFMENNTHVHIYQVKKNVKYFNKFKTFQDVITELRTEGEFKSLAEDLFKQMSHLRENLTHYLGSKELLEKNINKLLYIIEQDNYQEDFEILNKFLNKIHNIPIDNSYINDTHQKYEKEKNSNGCSKDLYVLSEENEKFLREYIDSEYKIYNYLKSIKDDVNKRVLI